MSDPKPIDPKRLELARSFDEIKVVINPQVACSIIGELISNIDYIHCDLMIEHELKLKARSERDAMRMKLATYGISCEDQDVQRHLGLLAGIEDETEEWTLKRCENQLADALGQEDHDGWESLLEKVKTLIPR